MHNSLDGPSRTHNCKISKYLLKRYISPVIPIYFLCHEYIEVKKLVAVEIAAIVANNEIKILMQQAHQYLQGRSCALVSTTISYEHEELYTINHL